MPISGKELRKIFEKDGWEFDHQSGSHMIMKKNSKHASIPNHKELGKGLEHKLRKLMKETI